MDNNVMKIVYTFFLGALLALFVGLGIQTFHPGPEMPEPTAGAEVVPGGSTPTEEQREEMEENERQWQQWQEEQQSYSRNVAVVALGASVVLLGLSLVLEKRNRVLTNGVMLGGLFTLLYAIGRSFASSETTMTFVAVSVGLAVVLLLGHRRFFQDPPAEKAPEEARREQTGV
ncbi:UNVERIFIED_CONTAM: hypothetical protein RF653_12955 [Kocuria sp. CPCC 205316]|uniref:hypothetical protein n=1 Tax=Kocuria TaxID=57493 RepID=UPI0036D8DE5A